MTDDDAFELKDAGLSQLLKAFSNQTLPKTKVGILGGDHRSNAEAERIKKGMKKRRDGTFSATSLTAESLATHLKSAEGVLTNAAIGALHEFGSEKLPIRSFLRMPINDQLQKFLEKSGAFDKTVLEEIVKSGSIYAWMVRVGIVAEQVVLEAFNTGGFGKWEASQMDHKQTKQTLVETQQLRNAITSETR